MNNKQYLELLLDQTHDLIWMVDQELQLVYANNAYLNLMKVVTGAEKELNTPILVEGFGEGYIEKWRTYYLRALSGVSFTIEEHFSYPVSKEIHYGHISFSPIKDEEGKVNCVVCRNSDVTSIVSEKYRASSLMDASLDVFCTINEAGNFVYVSKAANKHWGYTPVELINTPYLELVIKEDLDKTNKIAAAILAGEEIKSFVNRYKRKDGSIAYNLWSARWDDKEKLMYCVARDTKEKMEEEHRLKLLSSVITNTNDAVLITDAEPLSEPGPRIIYVNEAFTRMTGYTAEEVIGKTPRILQGPKSDKEALAKLGNALRNWQPYEITTLNYKKNGEEFWINFTVTPVADESGWYTHWIAIERDVTAQKNAELEKSLLTQIATCFRAEELNQAGEALCKVIQDFADFDLVEFWCSNMELSNLSRVATSTRLKDFEDANNPASKFSKGEDLPGKVWKQEKQLLWDKESIAKYFLRKKEAESAGLTHLLGVPLTHQDQITGVLVIGTTKGEVSLQKFSGISKNLGAFIGSEINRKRLEDDLRHLYQSIPEILCVADFEGRFLKMNPAGCNLLGYSEEEILFHPFDEFVHPEDERKFLLKNGGLPKESTVFNFENRFLSKDGEVICLSWNCNTALEDGLIYASAKNITAEVRLRELNAQASSLAKIGSWEVNIEKNTVFWSTMVHQLHETDPDSFTPDLGTAINFYREDFRPLVSGSFENSITTGVEFDFEAVIVTQKLKEKWVRSIGNVEMVNGKAKRVYGSFQDISDRKEIEIRLQSFANNLPGVVFQYVVYPDGTDALKYVTKGAEEIWELSPEEVMGNINLVWNQTKAGGDYEEVQKNIRESLKTKTKWISRYKSISPSGKIRTLLGTGTPNYLADGTVAYNSVVLDITNEAKNEVLLNKVSKIAKIGSWETDLLHGNHFKSKTVDEILGLELNQEIPSLESAIQFCREDFRELLQSNFINCIEKGQSFDCELVILTVNKSEKWVRIVASPEMFNGKCVKIYGSLHDIHERKLVEHQKNTLLTTLENSLNEIYVFDAQTLKFISVNKGARINLGYSEDELMEMTPLNLKPEFTETTFNELINPLVNKEKEKIIFFSNHRRKNGSLYPVEIHLQFIAEGNRNRYLAITLDITDRNEAENRLLASLKSLEDYQFALDQTAFITITDTKGVITSVNDNFCKISKYSREELIGKTHQIINSGHHPKSFFAELWNTVAQGKVFRTEMKNLAKDGSYFWADSIIVPFLDENNQPFQYLAIRIDITAKKLANERAIEILEEKNIILESIGDAFFAIDKNWTVTYWNKQAEIILGKSKEEMIGKNLWSKFPDVIDSEFYVQYHRAMEIGETVNFEAYYPPIKIWIDVTVYPSDTGLSIYFADVTVRKEADLRLISSNHEKNRILERITEAFVSLDTNWCYTYMNKKAGEIFNRDPKKMIGKHIWTEFPEGLNQPFHQAYEKAMATQEYIYLEDHYKPYDSWFENHIYPSQDGISIFFRDVSERKRNEEKLKLANERFEKVTEATNDAIWDWDIVNDTFYRSQNILHLFGKETPVILNSKNFWKDSFHPDDLKAVQESVSKALKDDQTQRWEMEYRILNGDGDTLYVIDKGLILRDGSGKAIRMIGAMSDVTELKRNEQQLLAINKKLRNIAWTQSHVVRAPLARILGIINLIETENGNSEDLMFWLNQLRVSSNEMDEIVKKITGEATEIQLNNSNE